MNELKKTLGEMKLPKTGNKAILIDCLVQAMQNNNTTPAPNSTQVLTTPSPQELL